MTARPVSAGIENSSQGVAGALLLAPGRRHRLFGSTLRVSRCWQAVQARVCSFTPNLPKVGWSRTEVTFISPPHSGQASIGGRLAIAASSAATRASSSACFCGSAFRFLQSGT